MRHRFLIPAAGAALLGLFMIPTNLPADEGMWLFNNPPRAQLKKHGFDPTDKWLDHVRLSSVRFNSGGSGSFVSPDGLVMTNHHVGADDLAKLSDREEQLPPRRVPRQDPRPGDQVQGARTQRPHRHQGRDRRGREGRAGRAPRRPRRSSCGTAKIAELEKARVRREEEHPRRRRHALRRRAVPPVHVQEVHRHPHRVRPREAGRVLRRRPGQLRVPAVRPRRALLPRLRERQAAQVRALPEVEPGRQQGRRTRVRLRAPRPDEPREHDRRTEVPPRHRLPVPAAAAQPARGAARRVERAERAERASAPRTNCSASRTAARPGSAGSAGLLDPELHGPQGRRRRSGCGTSSPARRSRPTGRDAVAGRGAEGVRHDREGREGPGRTHQGDTRCWRAAAGFNSRVVRHRPDAGSAPRRNCPSRPASGSASSPTPGCRASSSSCSPTSRSTRTSRRSSSPTGCTFLAVTLGPEHELVKQVLAGQVAARAGLRTDQRDEGPRPGVPQEVFDIERRRRRRVDCG